MTSVTSVHEAGHPKLVLWDNPRGMGLGGSGEGGLGWRGHMYPNVHCMQALFTIARTWKQLRCPSADKWIRKLWYIYTMEYYSAFKKHI